MNFPTWGRPLIKLSAGIILLLWLSIIFNPKEILNAITGVQISFLIVAFFIYAFTLFLLSMRWRFILKKMGYSIPMLVAYQGFVAGILISDFTPARIGELSRPLTIKNQVPISIGLGSVFLDRYCDFIAIFILGSAGILLLSASLSPLLLLITIIILSTPIILFSIFLFKRAKILVFVDMIKIPYASKFAHKLSDAMDNLIQPTRTIGVAIPFTIGVWVLQSARVVCIAKATGYILPIQDLFLIQPLISALTLVPLSLSGLGFVEGGYVSIFAHYGIPVATGLAIALLDRIITVGFHSILGIRYAIQTLEKKKSEV